MLVLGQRDERLVVRRLCRRRVYGVRRDVRVYAFDRLCSLDDRGGRGLFRGLSALAGADARAYDGSTVAGADVNAIAGADHAADVGALAGAHDGAAHAEANAGADAGPHAGADALTRPSHGGAGLCSDAAAIGPADGGARGFDARVVLVLLLANNICANCSGNLFSNNNICANCSGNLFSNEPRTLRHLR